mmetsp:Transcript_13344/g.38395  ORF Transcript_13344/g.38395 Transcript_13344/m.38395 type:complete len:254 (-) Transcript_13344:982-1743(-)
MAREPGAIRRGEAAVGRLVVGEGGGVLHVVLVGVRVRRRLGEVVPDGCRAHAGALDLQSACRRRSHGEAIGQGAMLQSALPPRRRQGLGAEPLVGTASARGAWRLLCGGRGGRGGDGDPLRRLRRRAAAGIRHSGGDEGCGVHRRAARIRRFHDHAVTVERPAVKGAIVPRRVLHARAGGVVQLRLRDHDMAAPHASLALRAVRGVHLLAREELAEVEHVLVVTLKVHALLAGAEGAAADAADAWRRGPRPLP